MRTILSKSLILILSILLLASCAKPDMYDAEGQGLRFDDLNEKWLIVNYWATWCAPCIAEIPELNALAEEQAARLTILGVNFDQTTGAELTRQIQKMKISFAVIDGAPHGLFNIALPQVLPTTYIFAPGGELRRTLVGPQTRKSLLAAIGSN